VALREHASDTPASQVARKIGVSEQTLHVWKRKYASLDVADVRKLRQLEEENITWSKRRDASALRERMKDLAAARPRCGYRCTSLGACRRDAAKSWHPGPFWLAERPQLAEPRLVVPPTLDRGAIDRLACLPHARCFYGARVAVRP